MKKFLILLHFLIFTLNTVFSQSDWFWQNPLPQGNSIYCMKFLNSSTGIAGTEAGTIIRTTNGGINWKLVYAMNSHPLHYKNTFTEIDFINEQTGFCIGYWGRLVKTTNAGLNWNEISNNINSSRDIAFINNLTGFVISSFGRIYWRTTDGGSNWVERNLDVPNLSSMSEMFFINAATGFITYNDMNILRTSNGGDNWNLFELNEGGAIADFCFINSQTGYAVGTGGKVLKTTNSGITWNSFDIITSSNLYLVYFYDENNGYTGGPNSILWKTSNGGLNWIYTDIDNNPNLFCNSKLNDSICIIGGTTGFMTKTYNYGINWARLSDSLTQNLRDIYFYNNTTGYVCGDGGDIYKTTNRGEKWTNHLSFNFTNLYEMAFISKDTGFLVAGSKLYKSTNGGNNWSFYSNTPNITNINFVNPNVGYGCGVSYNIYKTTNSGMNWHRTDSVTNYQMKAIHFINVNTGIAAGSFRTLIRTTNGGANWLLVQSLNQGSYEDVLYHNEKFIVIGTNGDYLTSSDFGSTWTNNNHGNDLRFDELLFNNSNIGWMVGHTIADAFIMKTTNGGYNWYYQKEITDNGYNKIYSLDNQNSFIIGNWGTIISTTNGGGPLLNIEENFNNKRAASFFLYQNYPNPFNPITKIKFELSDYSSVKVNIYSIIGKKITSLIDENLSPGTYELKWNASNQASGIYFYKLIVNGTESSKRMIFLK